MQWRNSPVGLARISRNLFKRVLSFFRFRLISFLAGRFQIQWIAITYKRQTKLWQSNIFESVVTDQSLTWIPHSLSQLLTAMAGKLFNVFAIVLFLGVFFVLVAEGSSNNGGTNNQLKKKTIPATKSVQKLPVSDDDEFMFADDPGSGDGEDFDTDNESNSNPPIEEIDPDFSVDGLPDLNELLPEGEIDIDMESASQRPPVKPPCQTGKPCHSVKPKPCRTGKRCPSVRPPPLCQTGRRCQSARRPCQSKRTCQSRRPCQSTKRPCPSPVKPAPILPPAFTPTKV